METRKASRLRWGRCVLGGLAAFATSLLLTVAVVSAYAISLGVEARGQPDQVKIQAFAEQVAPVMGPLLLILTTLVAAIWVARKTGAPVAHGVVVGAVAAIAALFPAWPPDLGDVTLSIVAVAAGWLGGTFGGRARSPVDAGKTP